MTKKELSNPARFWTGISMGMLEFILIIGFGLTLISWSWLTAKVLLIVLVALAIFLYNGIAWLLVWSGSGKE